MLTFVNDYLPLIQPVDLSRTVLPVISVYCQRLGWSWPEEEKTKLLFINYIPYVFITTNVVLF